MRSPVEICVMTCLLPGGSGMAYRAIRKTLYLLTANSISGALVQLIDAGLIETTVSDWENKRLYLLTDLGHKFFTECNK